MAKILIVDDVPDVVRVVKNILQSGGHDVMGANGGEDALNLLKDAKPDLILLDIMMPGIDGWQTLSLIRQIEGLDAVPVAMLTAKILTPGVIGEKDVTQLVDYIQKPFSKEGLLKRVDVILNRLSRDAPAQDKPIVKAEKESYQKILRLIQLHENMLNTLNENLKESKDPVEAQNIKQAIEYQENNLKALMEKKRGMELG